MKKHKYIDTFHCRECYEKTVKRALKNAFEIKPQKMIVSPTAMKALRKLELFKRT